MGPLLPGRKPGRLAILSFRPPFCVGCSPKCIQFDAPRAVDVADVACASYNGRSLFGELAMSPGPLKLKPQHAPKAPHQDPMFLESTAARPLRILAEYLHPLVQLKNEGIGDTIVMFGSARIESHETAAARVARLKKVKSSKLKSLQRTRHRAALRDAKSALEMSRYYEEARELAKRITTWALTLGPGPRRFVMCSGGGRGIMEGGIRGAAEAGGNRSALSVEWPHGRLGIPGSSPAQGFNSAASYW